MTDSNPNSEDPKPFADTLTFGGSTGSSTNVEITDPASIEETVLGCASPKTFAERYPFTGQIGEGGMGEVFVAQDLILKRDVAIKVLHKSVEPNSVVLRRFLREAQVTAQLSHPNVVPFYALESTGEGGPAFVMKLISGVTFQEFVEACRRAWQTPNWNPDELGLAVRVEHFLKVCDAIAYSHSRGVLHRDIKPANVMLGAYNVVYVMDWGIAKLIGEDLGQEGTGGDHLIDLPDTRTQTGDLIGTPLYMSPEQAKGLSRELTSASDQYALGLVLYNLITGEPPRRAESVIEVIRSAESGGRAPWPDQGIGADAEQGLRAIVDKATAMAVADRYESVVELAGDLRRYLRGEEVHACPDDIIRRVWRKVSHHPAKVLAALLCFVVATAAVTTWSLLDRIEVGQEAARRTDRLTNLITLVNDHVHGIDSRLANVQIMVEGISTRAAGMVQWAPSTSQRWLAPEDVAGDAAPPDTKVLERYGFRVTFSAAVRVLAPGLTDVAASDMLRRLGGLNRNFRSAFARTSLAFESGADIDAMDDRTLTEFIGQHTRLQYAYVGFASGLLINFPGYEFFLEEYDPRLRPWYQRGKENDNARWGLPYPDSSGKGYLLPCNMSVRAEDGSLLGVAGIDITLDRAVAGIMVPGLEHARASYMLDDDCRILIDSTEFQERLTVGLHGNREKERVSIGVPALEQRIAAGGQSGIVSVGDELFVFCRLRSLAWILVVRLDSDRELR